MTPDQIDQLEIALREDRKCNVCWGLSPERDGHDVLPPCRETARRVLVGAVRHISREDMEHLRAELERPAQILPDLQQLIHATAGHSHACRCDECDLLREDA